MRWSHAGFTHQATLSEPGGGRPNTKDTTSGAAPTRPPERVLRRTRQMGVDELLGHPTGRLGHLTDFSLRHRRKSNAGTTILYHLRNYRRIHSLSVITTGQTELLEHGHAAATTRAAGPAQDLPGTTGMGRSRSTLLQADDSVSGPSVRCTGLGGRLLAVADEAQAGYYYH